MKLRPSTTSINSPVINAVPRNSGIVSGVTISNTENLVVPAVDSVMQTAVAERYYT